MSETKKEHYVPRLYLRNFTNKLEKLFVYDKKTGKVFPNQHIQNVASENYFYDIDFDYLIEKIGEERLLEEIGIDSLDVLNPKFIEDEFNQRHEGKLSELLKKVIKVYKSTLTSELFNTTVLTEDDKMAFSFCLHHQMLRTRKYREDAIFIHETAMEKLVKLQLREEGETDLDFKLKIPKQAQVIRHIDIMMDEELGIEVASALMEYYWIWGINETKSSFYTSDNPILKIASLEDKTGIKSEGMHLAYPISSKLILLLFEKNFFGKRVGSFEDKFININEEYVKYYNSQQVLQSHRFVFCKGNDFSLAEDVCNEYPEIRDGSSVRVIGG